MQRCYMQGCIANKARMVELQAEVHRLEKALEAAAKPDRVQALLEGGGELKAREEPTGRQ